MARFSLKWLFVGIAVVGLLIAALARPSEWSLTLIVTLTVTGLIASTVVADKPFWRGFAIAGWAYFLLSFTPIDVWLLPTQAIVRLCAIAHPEHRFVYTSSINDRTGQWRGYGPPGIEPLVAFNTRVRTAQCIVAIAFGTLCGVATRRLTQ